MEDSVPNEGDQTMAVDEMVGAGFESLVYELAFDSLEAPILLTDTALTIRDVNEYALEFLGYEVEELVGAPAAAISGNEEQLQEVADTVARGDIWSGNFTAKTKDGETVFGRGSAGPVVIDGTVKAYVGVFIDTTKQRQYENTAEVLNRLLRHDLRNKLNIAHGNLQTIRPYLEDEEAIEYLNTAINTVDQINQQAERARDLRQLLENTYEATNQIIRLDYALNAAVADIINEHEEARLIFDAFPEVTVIADDLLERVFKAVLENGVVHNDSDVPTLTLSVEDRAEDVIVSIADNGPGVPDSSKQLIFGREEYNQLHHGSGLSLFFADNVIQTYNGEIWVEDNDPTGAVFKIRLPKP